MNLDDMALRRELLAAARSSIAARLGMGTLRPLAPCSEHPGLFVTLKRRGTLRGCIGVLITDEPFHASLPRLACQAAFEDPRFPPLTAEELAEVQVEITVLDPPRAVGSWQEIVAGEHGIWLHHGRRSAVFLPQVATEQGWTLEETLTALCRKAGLAEAAWRDADCRFEVFTAIHFAEGEA